MQSLTRKPRRSTGRNKNRVRVDEKAMPRSDGASPFLHLRDTLPALYCTSLEVVFGWFRLGHYSTCKGRSNFAQTKYGSRYWALRSRL